MAGNKQLKFSVKKKPETTDYVLHILDANFMIKRLRGRQGAVLTEVNLE